MAPPLRQEGLVLSPLCLTPPLSPQSCVPACPFLPPIFSCTPALTVGILLAQSRWAKPLRKAGLGKKGQFCCFCHSVPTSYWPSLGAPLRKAAVGKGALALLPLCPPPALFSHLPLALIHCRLFPVLALQWASCWRSLVGLSRCATQWLARSAGSGCTWASTYQGWPW